MLAEATLLVQAEAELDLVVDGDGDGVEDEDEDEDKGRPVSEIMDVGERFHPLRSSPLVLISQRFVFFLSECTTYIGIPISDMVFFSILIRICFFPFFRCMSKCLKCLRITLFPCDYRH